MRPIAHVVIMILVAVTIVFLFELIVRSYVFSAWLDLWKTALPYAAVGIAIVLIGWILRFFVTVKWKTIVTIAWIVMLLVEVLALAGVFHVTIGPFQI